MRVSLSLAATVVLAAVDVDAASGTGAATPPWGQWGRWKPHVTSVSILKPVGN
jgi:hypothetical protein